MRVQNGTADWSKVRVEIVEYDRWSGPSIFARKEFDTEEEANKFISKHNYEEGIGSGGTVPETYYMARIVR